MCHHLGSSDRTYVYAMLSGDNEDEAMAGLRVSRVSLGLALCALACLAGLATIQPANAQTSEEFVFRVAVRLHTNGTHLEFGIQRLDHERQPRGIHLEYHRFVALDTDHHRWLHADPSHLRQAPHYDPESVNTSVNNTRVRVVARLHPTRGLFQFGAQYELDSSQLSGGNTDDYAPIVLDRKQFFPSDISHHRWLYTGEIRFSRVWSGDATMTTMPTMEDEGSDTETTPSRTMDLGACLIAWDPKSLGMYPDECDDEMAGYCDDDPDHPSCINWRENRW